MGTLKLLLNVCTLFIPYLLFGVGRGRQRRIQGPERKYAISLTAPFWGRPSEAEMKAFLSEWFASQYEVGNMFEELGRYSRCYAYFASQEDATKFLSALDDLMPGSIGKPKLLPHSDGYLMIDGELHSKEDLVLCRDCDEFGRAYREFTFDEDESVEAQCNHCGSHNIVLYGDMKPKEVLKHVKQAEQAA